MWKIDYDHLDHVNATVASPDYDGRQLPERFRMYDDDGELYYEGRSSGVSFDPLDDYGAPNAGCTTIKYLEGGEWKTL